MSRTTEQFWEDIQKSSKRKIKHKTKRGFRKYVLKFGK